MMKGRILIIDDEPRWIDFAKSDLSKFEIVVARDVETAIAELEADQFRLGHCQLPAPRYARHYPQTICRQARGRNDGAANNTGSTYCIPSRSDTLFPEILRPARPARIRQRGHSSFRQCRVVVARARRRSQIWPTTPYRILVVDDLADWRSTLRGLLNDAEYQVETAESLLRRSQPGSNRSSSIWHL